MPTTILQAPVGAGKTQVALKHLFEVVHKSSQPFPKAWALLATKRQEFAFRQRLIESFGDDVRVHFNVEFFNFYELNARILNLAGSPPRRINQGARIGLLRRILDNLSEHGELSVYRDIAHTPGFLRVVSDFIYELKQNLVYPEIYIQIARARESKDRELARIYERYQQTVQQFDLVDREGEGWLALDAVRNNPHLVTGVSLLLVDGYDQFTPVQAGMLAQLSQQISEVKITLTDVPERDTKDLGLRFRQALTRLQNSHDRIGERLEFDKQIPDNPPHRHLDLQTLTREIFKSRPDWVDEAKAIRLIETPEPAQEAAAVLRRVKQLLLEGNQPDDILIALRDWARYKPHFETYQRLYKLPLLLHHSDTLIDNPVIATLLNVLELSAIDFRRRNLLDVLRSPYLEVAGLGAEQVDWLEQISQIFIVTGGRDLWQKSILRAAEGPSLLEDDSDSSTEPLINLDNASWLSLSLEAFCDQVTPSVSAPIERFVQWIENLIGTDPIRDPDDADVFSSSAKYNNSLKIIRSIRRTSNDERLIARDLTAIEKLKGILHGFLSTQELLRATTLGEASPLTWQEFYSDLKNSLASISETQRNPARNGKILVTTATDARGLPHKHVFILGLAEGIFPAHVAEDPLYLDNERQELAEQGVLLQTLAERADDTGLFYELISLPSHSLTLSRPTTREGKLWLESHLWREVKHIFKKFDITTIGIGEVVHPSDAASEGEVLLAVAHGLTDTNRQGFSARIHNWLVHHRALRANWTHIREARAVELRRLSRKPHDEYTGKLNRPELIALIGEMLGPRYIWSASQFNEYAACGYQFFAKRLLKLEALEEPQEGLDVLQRGTLYHAILEKTYRWISESRMVIEPENEEEAIHLLGDAAREEFETAPNKLGFRPSPYWDKEQITLLRRLEKIIRLDFSEKSPLHGYGSERSAYMQEAKFGMDSKPTVIIPLLDDNEAVRVRGSIDRIDRTNKGFLIVDYKSGGTAISVREIQDGRNFQMMVYLEAARQILRGDHEIEPRVFGGFFWHIQNQKADNIDPQETEAFTDGLQHLTRYVSQARSGNFAAQPSKLDDGRCASYCEFYQLCRVSMTNRYKNP